MNYSNLAQRTNFIAGSDKFDNLPFFLTNVNIPGINLSHPEIGGRDGVQMLLSGDTVKYSALSIEMLIDEDFLIYQELMEIINTNINIEDGTFTDFYFDFFIEINNSRGNKVLKIDFSNCRIESIGDISLDTQEEATEYTLTLEMVYDSYAIDQERTITSIDETIDTPETVITPETFSDNFINIVDWVLWGFPSPIISPDVDASNEFGFDSNGAGAYESGAVLNTLEIPVLNPFEFIFRAKQPLGTDSNDALYLVFGITEGIGIESTSNGRTGSTIMGVLIDGGNKKSDSSIKQISYQFKGIADQSEDNYSNDGEYHNFKFVYTPASSDALYEIYKDDVLKYSLTSKISNHDNLYLFIQGKSEEEIQIIDTIAGEYGSI